MLFDRGLIASIFPISKVEIIPKLITHSLCFLLGILFNPLRPNNDLSQTSLCNIKGLSVREVLRIENMITQMKFY